jgi:beta-glucosidase
VEDRVEALLRQMTLEEKVGQMCQYVGIEHLKDGLRRRGKVPSNDDAVGMYPGLTFGQIEEMVREGRIGSFLHVVTLEEADRLQALARESRLQIPLLIGIDAIHGNGMVRGATVYPSPIGLAATFDTALVEAVARQTAVEVRAAGAHWTFSPNVDVARDARWGRVGETFGEDPFLVGEMGAAMVRGYQGSGAIPAQRRVLACIKHLIAGSASVNGLNAAPTDVSERTLRSVFLPPYLASVREGAGSLMLAHNELNGVPCHANRWLVEDLLRTEGGFQGFVVSDWLDVGRLVSVHRVAPDMKAAVDQTVNAGLDLHMHGPGFFEALVELVREGRVSEERVNASVRRLLHAKFQLGLFEETVPGPAEGVLFNPRHQALALQAARKSVVLLRNEASLLPVDPARYRRILVTGPLADHPAVLGDWTLPQPEENVITVLEGIRSAAPETCEIVHYDCGSQVRSTSPDAIRAAVAEARRADLAVVVVGDNSLRFDKQDKTGGENVARSDIELPGRQLELLQALHATGIPIVAVLINGRPLGSVWTAEHVAALLEVWEPGSLGGQAVGEILFGAVNPSGRLPISVPRSAGHIQTIYNHMPSQYFHHYVIGETGPLFQFGEGLSYTTFRYTNLTVSDPVPPDQPVSVTVDVSNTGSRAGEEVVLVYLNDVVSRTTTPVKALKAFRRVTLQPGETRTVSFTLARGQLALLDETLQPIVEPGEFEVMVGDQTRRFHVP